MRNILPGRPQSSRQALCTVNWDGLRVVAYISGDTVVIFNGRREILQSISVDDAAPSLHSLIIEEQTGHIAVSDKNNVYVYRAYGRDYGDLRWTRAQTLPSKAEDSIRCLSWSSSDELLVAGDRMTLWNLSDESRPAAIWISHPSSPANIALFSPDGCLFASCGEHDRAVKIWRRLSYEQDSTRFDVSYLPHPAAVTNFSWRKSWHQEQNLANLLYTYCVDRQVRVWAHADHHAYCTLQKVVTIDTTASIQPRRMSMGSMSKQRYTLILESRDLARAAERALQVHQTGIDHALEHLVAIANRSPEICVVLDGLGHMSAWGIENAGLKNKLPPEKFNVALVDGVNIDLLSQSMIDGPCQIQAFTNNDISASLCILVHSYSGQIDWYQGSVVDFFDTGARAERVRLQSCWSGHDAPVKRLVTGRDGCSFLSLTEADEAILWSQSPSGALVRASQAQSDYVVLNVALLAGGKHVAFLHAKKVTLWDLSAPKGSLIAQVDLKRGKPIAISSTQLHVAVIFEGNHIDLYKAYLPRQTGPPHTNGLHKPLTLIGTTQANDLKNEHKFEFCTKPNTGSLQDSLFSWSEQGLLQSFGLEVRSDSASLKNTATIATSIEASNIASVFSDRMCAVVHADCRTISVWNLRQRLCEFTKAFRDYDSVQELYWQSSPTDLLLLAVQFPYHVAIIGQHKYGRDPQVSPWRLQQVISTRTYSNHVVGAVCWIDTSEVAVSLGNQIITFSVEPADITKSDLSFSLQERRAQAIGERLGVQKHSLPIFSPSVLACQLEIGKYDIAMSILQDLQDKLKFSSTGEDIDLDARTILAAMDSNDRLHSSNNWDDADFNLEDAQPQMEENISKISKFQLPEDQKQDLRRLIQVTVQLLQNTKAMDNFALTYLYHFLKIVHCLEEDEKELQPLPFAAIVHASLSQTQEALLYFVLAYIEERDIKLTWSTAKALGMFLFINDEEALKVHLESVARNEYQRNPDDRNPVDCSLYYLALDKKAVLQALWRRTVGVKEKESTLKLLAHDFTQQKWRATASKNAYALLSRRRFEYAAAFFLLAGGLSDAVNVCVNQMHDFHLGIAITRVWGGDKEDRDKVTERLMSKSIPELAVGTHEARWLLLWRCVQHEDCPKAVQYIVDSVDQLLEHQFKSQRETQSEEQRKENLPFEAMSYKANEPSLLLNLYKILRDRLVQQGLWTNEIITPVQEWAFIMRCVDWYLRAGLDWVALQLVAQWPFVEWQIGKVEFVPVPLANMAATTHSEQKSVLDDWLDSEPPNAASKKVEENEGKPKSKPPPTQFVEPSTDSLLDSFGF